VVLFQYSLGYNFTLVFSSAPGHVVVNATSIEGPEPD
jgi:hypothetical protein